MTLFWKFFNRKQAQQKVNHCCKKKRKGEKGKAKKKFQKSKSVKTCLSRNMPVARKASCRVANVFSTRLKLIWPRSSLQTTKMSKKCIFAESSRSQWVKIETSLSALQIEIKVTNNHWVVFISVPSWKHQQNQRSTSMKSFTTWSGK